MQHNHCMNWERFALAVVFVAGSVSAQQSASVTPQPLAIASTNAIKRPTLAEVERQYLDGKITARDFQKYLQTYRSRPRPAQPVAAVTNDVHLRALALLHTTKPNMAANREGPALTEPLPDPEGSTNETANAAVIQDVETKIDELIRLKEAREQGTNTSSTNAPAGNLTKRQRLDALLRLHIEGKLSDAEYKQRREKILLEPGD